MTHVSVGDCFYTRSRLGTNQAHAHPETGVICFQKKAFNTKAPITRVLDTQIQGNKITARVCQEPFIDRIVKHELTHLNLGPTAPMGKKTVHGPHFDKAFDRYYSVPTEAVHRLVNQILYA